MRPANTLTFEQVAQEFSAAGCTLLEHEYKNTRTPMRFLCTCGREGHKTLVHFRRGQHCKQCGYAAAGDKNGRLTLDEVAARFKAKGRTLLATTYTNKYEKLPYVCKCGARHEMSLTNVMHDNECPACTGRTEWTLETVRQKYEEQGCALLETEYRGINASMQFRCSCGSLSKTSFGNFHYKNVRCKACGIKKLSGENSYQYKPEKTDEERITQRKYPAYSEWRKAVFARDGHACQVCHKQGVRLNAHHLDNYADHPELRTDVDNGVTLCEGCHQRFHEIYGRKTATFKSQFLAFVERAHA